MLSDTAKLAACHVRVSYGVEQGGLAVIDVAHYYDDRRTRYERRGIVLDVVKEFFFLGQDYLLLDRAAHILYYERGGVKVEVLVHGSHYS